MAPLLAEYRDRLKRMVRLRLNRRLQGRVDESDVVQEAFIEVSRRLGEYVQDPEMPFYLWVRQITGLEPARGRTVCPPGGTAFLSNSKPNRSKKGNIMIRFLIAIALPFILAGSAAQVSGAAFSLFDNRIQFETTLGGRPFLSALEKPSHEAQRAYIERMCAEDPALLARVLALLESHQSIR